MNVQIITVGDEILIGQIVDTNSAWIGQELNKHGARVCEIRSVSDDLAAIELALKQATEQADMVLMTGGLGPTKDDITKQALANFYGTGFVYSQETYDRLVTLLARFGRTPVEGHRAQALMPQNATLLTNKRGTAPGMWFDEHDTVVVSMPGVPYEMKYLMEHEVIPRLKTRFPQQAIAHRTIRTVGEGESRIADRIAAFEDSLPAHIKLAYLPSLGSVRLRLSGIGNDQAVLEEELNVLVEAVKPQVLDLIYGYDTETLEEAVGKLLKERGLTLATAESCTGGFLAHKITSISGSSAYFMGSIVAYDNAVKTKQLGVQAATLETDGAVSEACVRELAEGVRQRLGTSIGVGISGIAGPGGGTAEKPVGTIWLAVATSEGIRTQQLSLHGDRMLNIEYTAVAALNLIRKAVLGMD